MTVKHTLTNTPTLACFDDTHDDTARTPRLTTQDGDGYITASDLVDAGIVPYAFLAEGIINQVGYPPSSPLPSLLPSRNAASLAYLTSPHLVVNPVAPS